ncbi:MAG: serine/threonine-protein kinase [Gemmataceae bacterium]
MRHHTTSLDSCPRPTEWEAVLGSPDPDPRFDVLLAHADGCWTCQGMIARLSSADPAVALSTAVIGPPLPFVDEPGCRQLLSAARLLPSGPAGGGSPPDALPLPFVLGEYRLTEVVGRGGMSVVYRGVDLRLSREVAVKVLSGFPRLSTVAVRLREEAVKLARLSHEHIVPIYAVGEHDGLAFFTMPLLDGGTLHRLGERGGVPPRAAAELLRPIAEAVEHAHQAGLVHRDLKPVNILQTRSGKPMVADFGLALEVAAEGADPARREVAGTAGYMAPEQWDGRVGGIDGRTDVYGLGAILHYLLTGRPPGPGGAVGGRSCPRDLDAIRAKCLARDPEQRYPTAQQLADDLGRFLARRPVSARPVSAVGRGRYWLRRNVAAAAVAGALGVAGLAVASGLVPPDPPPVAVQTEYDRATRECEAGRIWAGLELLADLRRRLPAQDRDWIEYIDQTTAFWRNRFTGEFRMIAELDHPAAVSAAAVSEDGRQILTGCDDGSVRLWSSAGKLLWSRKGHTAQVSSVAFGTTGRLCVSGGYDHKVSVYRTADGQAVAGREWPGWAVEAVALTADDTRVVVGSADKSRSVRMCELSDGLPGVLTEIAVSDPSAEGVRQVAADDRGASFVSLSQGGEVYFRDGLTGRLRKGWGSRSAATVTGAVLTPDGRPVLATTSGLVVLTPEDGGRRLDIQPAPFDDDDKLKAVSVVSDRGEVTALVARGNELVYREWNPDTGVWRDTGFGPADRRAFLRGRRVLDVPPPRNRVSVWEPPATTTTTRSLEGRLLGRAVVSSRDGTRVAAFGSVPSRPRSANVAPGQCYVQVFNGTTLLPETPAATVRQARMTGLGISPDGRRLAVGADGPDAEVFVADIVAGRPLDFRPVGRHQYAVSTLTFRPDGRRWHPPRRTTPWSSGIRTGGSRRPPR